MSDPFSPRPDGWRDVAIAALLAAAYCALLLATVDEVGYARDEGFYFHASRRYEEWLQLLWRDRSAALAVVDEYWHTNSEHPALVKTLFALSHALLGGLFDREGTSYRFPAMALSGMGVGLTYLWGARAVGRLAGAVAAVSLGAMPHFFFHAHLACFDAPVVAMWTLCAYAYWRALQRGGLLRALSVAVTFALALDTKHNAWFLPVVCGAHAALMLWVVRTPEARRQHLCRAVPVLVGMAVISPLLWVASWPWLWHDTVPRIVAYARFHLEHVYYNMEFLGRNYFEPPMPRAYAFVMTAATVPTITLCLFLLGAGRSLADFVRREPGVPIGRSGGVPADAGSEQAPLFWLLAIAVQYAAWLRPETPIFGGTKHWMTAYPFLALLGGAACARAAVSLHRWRHAPLLFAVLCVLPPCIQAAHAHPWGLSSYTPLVGGAPGAASLGLNRGFWGYTTGAVAPYLNRVAPRNARIYIHDTAWPAWDMLLRDGRLRKDLRGVGQIAEADLALYHHELHMQGVEQQIWVAFETSAPLHVAGLDGVPIIWIYGR